MPTFNRLAIEQGAWDQDAKSTQLLVKSIQYIAEFHRHSGKGDLPKSIEEWKKGATKSAFVNLQQITEVTVTNPEGEAVRQLVSIYPIVSAALAKFIRAQAATGLELNDNDWLALSYLINGYRADDEDKTTLELGEKQQLIEVLTPLIDPEKSFVDQHASVLRHLTLNELEPRDKGVLKDKYQVNQLLLLEACFKILALSAMTHELEALDRSHFKHQARAWEASYKQHLGEVYDADTAGQLCPHDILDRDSFIARVFDATIRDNGRGYDNLDKINHRPSSWSASDGDYPLIAIADLQPLMREFIEQHPKVLIETKAPAEIGVNLDKLKATCAEAMKALNAERARTGDAVVLEKLKTEIVELISGLQRSEIDEQNTQLREQYHQALKTVDACKSKLVLFQKSLNGRPLDEITPELEQLKSELTHAYEQLLTVEKDSQRQSALQQEKQALLESIDTSKSRYEEHLQALAKARQYDEQWQRVRSLLGEMSATGVKLPEDVDSQQLSELLETYSAISTGAYEQLQGINRELLQQGTQLADLESTINARDREIQRLESSTSVLRARLIHDIGGWQTIEGVTYPSRDGLAEKTTSALLELYREHWTIDYQHAAAYKESPPETELVDTKELHRLKEENAELRQKVETLEAAQTTVASPSMPESTQPTFDFVRYVESFKAAFRGTNSTGVQRIIYRMEQLQKNDSIDAGDKLILLRSTMNEQAVSLRDRGLSKMSFWKLMRGRTNGVQALYDKMAETNFLTAKADEALDSLKEIFETNTAQQTLVHG